MISSNVWQGIDRVAFHENAILLDVKLRSLGNPIKPTIYDDPQVEPKDGLTPQHVRNILDDLALVASGDGGSDNVSAVCMEHDESLGTSTFRMSSNEGVTQQKLGDLRRLLELTMETLESGIESRYEEVLTAILQQCAVPFSKHATKFSNELRQAQCPPDKDLQFPSFSSQNNMAESSTDTARLGTFSRDCFLAYMQLSSDRLCQLRRMCAELGDSGRLADVPEMMVIAKAAHDVRRSSSFDLFLRHNIRFSQKPSAIQSMAESLKERLGKLSRYWRAAQNLTVFGSMMLARKIAVNILCLSPAKHTVEGMQHRTLSQLRTRGGRGFQSCAGYLLQSKLGQWERYRLHCELQLVVFYQENPHLPLRNDYIGCNKLACYLCHSFITSHGRFKLQGCHQGLYSLWTVPDTICFRNREQAHEFRRALRELAQTLESRVSRIRKSKQQWKFISNHESTANLSRISLYLPLTTTPPLAITKTASEASDTRTSSPLFQTENFDNLEIPSRRHDLDHENQSELPQTCTTSPKADSPVTPSPENDIFDQRSLSPASTTEVHRLQQEPILTNSFNRSLSGQKRRAMNGQVPPQWGAILRTPETSKNISNRSTATNVSILPPILEDETDSGGPTGIPQASKWKADTASQVGAQNGAVGYVHHISYTSLGFCPP